MIAACNGNKHGRPPGHVPRSCLVEGEKSGTQLRELTRARTRRLSGNLASFVVFRNAPYSPCRWYVGGTVIHHVGAESALASAHLLVNSHDMFAGGHTNSYKIQELYAFLNIGSFYGFPLPKSPIYVYSHFLFWGHHSLLPSCLYILFDLSVYEINLCELQPSLKFKLQRKIR